MTLVWLGKTVETTFRWYFKEHGIYQGSGWSRGRGIGVEREGMLQLKHANSGRGIALPRKRLVNEL